MPPPARFGAAALLAAAGGVCVRARVGHKQAVSRGLIPFHRPFRLDAWRAPPLSPLHCVVRAHVPVITIRSL